MFVALALLVGLLYGTGLYLLLRRQPTRILFGLVLLGHAGNLLIFTASGLERGQPPLAAVDAVAPPPDAADPLPQALVLTAIVISFAVLAFAAVLIARWSERHDSTNLEEEAES